MTDDNIREFQPLYPWVFVRVLQKEQTVGKIVLVEGPKQNKPTHEGVVLKTWLPTTKIFKGKPVEVYSQLRQGQHVVFPHWAGLPVVGFDDKHYRIVKEIGWESSNEGGIFGLMQDADAAVDSLQSWLLAHPEIVHPDKVIAFAREMLERFVIVDREKPSVTMSGV